MVKYVSWIFSGFIWKLFECGLILESIQIQTLNLFLFLKLNSKQNLGAGPFSSFPVRPSRPRPLHFAAQQTQADQLRRPRSPSPLFLPLHPLTGMAHATAASFLSIPILSTSPRMRPHRATRAAAARARVGTRAPPGWRARRGAGAHTHANQTRPWGGISSFAPASRPCVLAGAEGASAASAARPVRARVVWGFRPDDRSTGLQRQKRAATRTPKPPTPLGFSLLHQ
jgi:hypothetical protein